MTDPIRNKFEKHFKHLDLSKQEDCFGGMQYSNTYTDAVWCGWNNAINATPVPPTEATQRNDHQEATEIIDAIMGAASKHQGRTLRTFIAGIVLTSMRTDVSKDQASHAYRMIDKFLRNGLGDLDYVKHSSYLKAITEYRPEDQHDSKACPRHLDFFGKELPGCKYCEDPLLAKTMRHEATLPKKI